MQDFPWGVSSGLALILIGVCWFIVYILKMDD